MVSPDNEANVWVEYGHQYRHGDEQSVEEHDTGKVEGVSGPQEVREELVTDEEAKQRVDCQDLEEEEPAYHSQQHIMGWEVVQEVLWGKERH